MQPSQAAVGWGMAPPPWPGRPDARTPSNLASISALGFSQGTPSPGLRPGRRRDRRGRSDAQGAPSRPQPRAGCRQRDRPGRAPRPPPAVGTHT